MDKMVGWVGRAGNICVGCFYEHRFGMLILRIDIFCCQTCLYDCNDDSENGGVCGSVACGYESTSWQQLGFTRRLVRRANKI